MRAMLSHLAPRLFLALAIVSAGLTGSWSGSTVLAAQAAGPCALLTADEIKPFAKTPIGEGVPSAIAAAGSSACRFAWGAGAERHALDVIVRDAARAFPGVAPDAIKQGLAASV